ncbi:MAG TPA: hypothetical protein VH814_11980 [Steroidobacteraceae bacterium]|jgi:hypothetical protein
MRWFFLFGLLLIGAGCSSKDSRSSPDDLAFESRAGVPLPSGVTAVAYRMNVNDNLLHKTHYWMLRGPDASLRILASSFKFERSDQDAKWQLPDMQLMFGVSLGPSDIAEGYEGSPDGKRDRWLVLFSNGRGALFVY